MEFAKLNAVPASATKGSYWQNLLERFSATSAIFAKGTKLNLPDSSLAKIYPSQSLCLDEDLIKKINVFSGQHNLSVATLFYAAWGLLLSRFSNETQWVFGSPLGRPIAPLNVLAAKSLPIAIALDPQQTLLSFLQQLEQQLNESEQHSEDFFAEVQIHKTALVAHMAKFTSLCYLPPSDIAIEQLQLTEQAEAVDLILFVQSSSRLKVQLFYSPSAFTQTEIVNLLTHFNLALQACIYTPTQTTLGFTFLTAEEQQTLYHWGNIGLAKNTNILTCVPELFSQRVSENPTALAVLDVNKTLTYLELDNLSNQLVHFLLAEGATPGQPIAVALARNANLIVAMVAIFKLGAIYVPLEIKSSQQRIAYILQDCGAEFVLTDQAKLIPAAFKGKIVALAPSLLQLVDYPQTANPSKMSLADVAYLSYSADATEQPKGTIVTHQGLANLAQWYQAVLKVTAADKAAQFAAASYAKFFCETWPFLVCGASISLIDDAAKWAPEFFLTWLTEQDITICDLPVAYARVLFELTWPNNLALRLLKIGGEPIAQYPSQVFPFDIWHAYGCAETTTESIFAKIYRANTPLELMPTNKPPIGRPIHQVEAYVVDQHGQLAPIGAVGELLLGGAGIAQGYLNHAQLTQEKFIANAFLTTTQSKLYKTGDLVRWSQSGELEFIGRSEQQVNLLGFRVALNEIAANLNQLPDVAQVNVVAQEIAPGQKKLVAYVVPNIASLRIPYHTPCLVMSADMHCAEYISEDLSVGGVSLSGVNLSWEKGLGLRLYLQLPGVSSGQWLTGSLIWQQDERVGIQFILTDTEKALLQDSLAYYFTRNNAVAILENALLRRNLGRALRKKLPGYMVPTVYVPMQAFPLDARGKLNQNALPLLEDRQRLGQHNVINPQTPTEKALAAIWAELLNEPTIGINDDFFALGGNSLLVTQLLLQVLQTFKILMPMTLFLARPYLSTLANYLESEGTLKLEEKNLRPEIDDDVALAEAIYPEKSMPLPPQAKDILLTGATGFLGIHLLKELLDNSAADTKVYCLIRAENAQMAKQRLAIAAEKYQLGKLAAAKRIVPLVGDLSKPYFGLPVKKYATLSAKINCIYHSGAFSHKVTSYANLRPTNVLGTLEVIKFAVNKINKPIHYISTLAAASTMDYANNLLEAFPGVAAKGITENYALSKWVAEKLLATMQERGLPVTIYRLGEVTGQYGTGICNPQDALLLLLKGCAQLGYAPRWQQTIHLLPVDYVSKAIVNISQAQTEGVFHLTHPQGLPWLDLLAWLNQHGEAIQLATPSAWQTLLINEVTQSNALYPLLSCYLMAESAEDGIFSAKAETARAQAMLTKLQLPYPMITDNFLNNLFSYLRRVKFM